MTRSTNYAAALAILLAFRAGAVMPAMAQENAAAAPAAEQVPPPVTPPAQVGTDYRAAPVVRLFGVPAAIWAPVDPPYTGAAYSTLGGQAETSADVVAEQGIPWH